MAHDVLIAGALFPDVPSVQFPDSQQQWHSFTDVSDTTAAAADVASGKQFYAADGTLTQGTASGGGGGAPKMGVLRPDAELWKSWTYDKLIVTDEGATIPAYSTSVQTLKASETIETVTLDMSNYDYEVLYRTLSYPIYAANTSYGSGRFAYSWNLYYYDVMEIPADTIHDNRGASYNKRAGNYKSYSHNAEIYYYSSSQLNMSTSFSYGCLAATGTSSISNGVLTITSPTFRMRGNTSQYSSTYWNATTDVRYQYVIELYRTPKNNQYFDGYSLKSLAMHAIECAQSATGKLT